MFVVQNVPRLYTWYFYGPYAYTHRTHRCWEIARVQRRSAARIPTDCVSFQNSPGTRWRLRAIIPHTCLNSSLRIISALMVKQKWALASQIFPASWPPRRSPHPLRSITPRQTWMSNFIRIVEATAGAVRQRNVCLKISIKSVKRFQRYSEWGSLTAVSFPTSAASL